MAMLNWHPVVEYEIREIEREKRLQRLRSETEQRRIEELQREIAHELRMQRLRKENAREAELDAKIAALWPSSTTSSHQTPPPERDSPT
ncbi:MAG: hypothetical protein NTY67_09600 [Cyanobacteria bacterium]|nr:hypothetical protein [Cyanobacteriota bacterium]